MDFNDKYFYESVAYFNALCMCYQKTITKRQSRYGVVLLILPSSLNVPLTGLYCPNFDDGFEEHELSIKDYYLRLKQYIKDSEFTIDDVVKKTIICRLSNYSLDWQEDINTKNAIMIHRMGFFEKDDRKIDNEIVEKLSVLSDVINKYHLEFKEDIEVCCDCDMFIDGNFLLETNSLEKIVTKIKNQDKCILKRQK